MKSARQRWVLSASCSHVDGSQVSRYSRPGDFLSQALRIQHLKLPIILVTVVNQAWLLKNSFARNYQKQNCARKPYKRLS